MRHCYTVVDDSETKNNYRVAKVFENKSGYYPLGKKDYSDPHELDKFCGSYDDMFNIVKFLNIHEPFLLFEE